MAEVNHFLLDWSFEKCKIELCNFGGLKMKKSRFYECIIFDSDFIDAQLSEADFSLSDLQGCVFRNTNLEGANFSGAKHYYIDPAQNKLKKAKFSMPEAMNLLIPFGMEID
jgi:uncharacterized protein YjbI with pentapeptide repeats